MPHPGGRPRESSPSPEECVRLGEDLVKWATEETDEWRCLFGQWWSLKQKMLRKEWKALIQISEFLPYYEMAQQALAKKALDGTMREGFGHRYIRLYDRDLKEEEDATERFKSDLKKQEQVYDKESLDRFEKTMSMLKDIQNGVKD